MAVALRILHADDWPLWRLLRLAALADAPHAFRSRLADWQGDGDREERWRARLSIAGSHNLIALVDGEPAGMASGVPAGEDVELISLWVAPCARGRGVADCLIAAVVAWARARAARAVRLEVMADNAPALALYARHGFVDAGAAGPAGHERVLVHALAPPSAE